MNKPTVSTFWSSERFTSALAYAFELHKNDVRKVRDVPYFAALGRSRGSGGKEHGPAHRVHYPRKLEAGGFREGLPASVFANGSCDAGIFILASYFRRCRLRQAPQVFDFL